MAQSTKEIAQRQNWWCDRPTSRCVETAKNEVAQAKEAYIEFAKQHPDKMKEAYHTVRIGGIDYMLT